MDGYLSAAEIEAGLLRRAPGMMSDVSRDDSEQEMSDAEHETEKIEDRSMQLICLEQLCMELIMSGDVNEIFGKFPAEKFLSILCGIIQEVDAPENIIELAARAITYFLDVDVNCGTSIVGCKNGQTVPRMCALIRNVSLYSKQSRDLTEQLLKALELICARHGQFVARSGGLDACLHIVQFSECFHTDTLRSAATIASNIAPFVSPKDETLSGAVKTLLDLLVHNDEIVVEHALNCFKKLAIVFAQQEPSAELLHGSGLVGLLVKRLKSVLEDLTEAAGSSTAEKMISILSLLLTCSRSSCAAVLLSKPTRSRRKSDSEGGIAEGDDFTSVISRALLLGDRISNEAMVMVENLRRLVFDGVAMTGSAVSIQEGGEILDRLIDAIHAEEGPAAIAEILDTGANPEWCDAEGISGVSWAAYTGQVDVLELFKARGVNFANDKSSVPPLHHAIIAGSIECIEYLLDNGVDRDVCDSRGRTALQCAEVILERLSRERQDESEEMEEDEITEERLDDLELEELPYDKELISRVIALLMDRRQVDRETELGAHIEMKEDDKKEESSSSDLADPTEVEQTSHRLKVYFATVLLPCLVKIFNGTVRQSLSRKLARLLNSCLGKLPSNALVNGKVLSSAGAAVVEYVSSVITWTDVAAASPDQRSTFKDAIVGADKIMQKARGPFLNAYRRTGVLDKIAELYELTKESEDPRGEAPMSQATDEDGKADSDNFFPGDAVRVVDDLEEARRLCEHGGTHCGYTQPMDNYIGKIGEVASVTPSGNIRVCFADGSTHAWHPKTLTKLGTFQKGFMASARENMENLLKAAHEEGVRKSDGMSRLETIVEELRQILSGTESPDSDILRKVLIDIKSCFAVDNRITVYEMIRSGFVDMLVEFLTNRRNCSLPLVDRVNCFKNTFFTITGHRRNSNEFDINPPSLIRLVRKLQHALTLNERFRVSTSEQGQRLEMLKRPFQFTVVRHPDDTAAHDFSGRTLQVEPLVNSEQLMKHLQSQVMAKWYEHPWNELDFVKYAEMIGRAEIKPLLFENTPESEQGVLHWIGTNMLQEKTWTNPCTIGAISLTTSDGARLAQGVPEEFVGELLRGRPCCTEDRKKSWVAIDVGLHVIPTAYRIKHERIGGLAPRSWRLEGSMDAVEWTTLHNVNNCNDLSMPPAVGNFEIVKGTNIDDLLRNESFRHFRITLMRKNNGGTQQLSFCGFELFGIVTGVSNISPAAQRKAYLDNLKVALAESKESMTVGTRVTRSPFWTLGNQDGDSIGRIVDPPAGDGIVKVRWDSGHVNSYRFGANDVYDVMPVGDRDKPFTLPDVPARPRPPRQLMARPRWEERAVVRRDFSALIAAFDPRPGVRNAEQTRPFNVELNDEHRDSVSKQEADIAEEAMPMEIADAHPVDRPKHAADSVPKGEAAYEIDLYLAGPSERPPWSFFYKLNPRATLYRSIIKFLELATEKIVKDRKLLRRYRFRVPTNADGSVDIGRLWDMPYVLVYRLKCVDGKYSERSLAGRKKEPWNPRTIGEKLRNGRVAKKAVIAYLRKNADPEWLQEHGLKSEGKSSKKALDRLADLYREFYEVIYAGDYQGEDDENYSDTAPDKDLLDPLPMPGDEVEQTNRPAVEVEEESIKFITPCSDAADNLWPEHTFSFGLLQNEPFDSKCINLLHILRRLNEYCFHNNGDIHSVKDDVVLVPESEFVNLRITKKLEYLLRDPLLISSQSLPVWSEKLTREHSFLFPYPVRLAYFSYMGFGISRALCKMQQELSQSEDKTRAYRVLLVDLSRFRVQHAPNYEATSVGRLVHEQVTVQRGEKFLSYSMAVLEAHASRKAMLEVIFEGESGTGLGVTMEFYSMSAAEIRRSSVGLWVNLAQESPDGEVPEFVVNDGGLFPNPLPPDEPDALKSVRQYFLYIGRLTAKALQDGRIVDLPLSTCFWRAVLGKPVRLSDYMEVDPSSCRNLLAMEAFVNERNKILRSSHLTDEEKQSSLNELRITLGSDRCYVEELFLSMQYLPTSHNIGYESYDLVPNGSAIDVTAENLADFVKLNTEFILKTGIETQITAFRDGFNEVFPLSSLSILTIDEIKKMLNGERLPEWTFDDLMASIDAKNGYTKGSEQVIWLLSVLTEMDGHARKKFLRFATGCDSLPPGGLINLTPRLTVVLKTDDKDADAVYPSVNCCFHFIKLPAYSSKEILADRLSTAMETTGFYFN